MTKSMCFVSPQYHEHRFTIYSAVQKVDATPNSLYTPHRNLQEYPTIAYKTYDTKNTWEIVKTVRIRLQAVVDGAAASFGLSTPDDPRCRSQLNHKK